MKIKTLSATLACTLPFTGTFAAALDRSGQSISGFLQPDNYAELGLSILDPSVSGKESDTSETRRAIGDMADDYAFANAAFKFQPTKRLSFGVIYDQPFGASATYSGNNIFVADATNTILPKETLDDLRQSTIAKNVAAVLPSQLENTLKQQLTPTVNTIISQQAQQALASGQAPTGATQAMIEASIRNDSTKMAAITNAATQGITQAVTSGVEAEVTRQVNAGLQQVNSTLGKGVTQVDVDTHAWSLIAGFQPNENWNIYGGAVYQTLEANVKLRGQAYSLFNGYDVDVKKQDAWGWLAGVAYQIPEIALKASLTYRSDIDYDLKTTERLPTLGALSLLGEDAAAAATQIATLDDTTAVSTPRSVNLDLQSGIMQNTVAFANIRWVNWSNFSIKPAKFGRVSDIVGQLQKIDRPQGFNLVSYDKDQWSITTGIGRKLNEQWAGNFSVGWDSGAGNPVTTLGPTEGFWNVGLGVQFSPAQNYFVAGGVKYFWLGDADAQTGAQAGDDRHVASFSDNTAVAYGMKMGYRF